MLVESREDYWIVGVCRCTADAASLVGSASAAAADGAAGGCSRSVTVDGANSSSLKMSGFTGQIPASLKPLTQLDGVGALCHFAVRPAGRSYIVMVRTRALHGPKI